MAYYHDHEQQYYESTSYNHQVRYQSESPWVVFVEDPCDCCGNPSHILDDCPVFYERLEAQRRREDENLFHSRSSYYQYEEEYQDYGHDTYLGYNNFESEFVQSCDYQGEPNEYSNEVFQDDYNNYYAEMTQDFGYVGEQEAYFNEDPREDAMFEMLKELKRDFEEMKKDLEEIKEENEARDISFDELVKQFHQLTEEWAQIKRDREDSANGMLVDDDVQEEVIHLINQEDMSSIASEVSISPKPEPVIVVEEPINKVIPVCPNPSFESNMLTDKCGEDGSSKEKRRVSLQDLGQCITKWPSNCYKHRSMASEKLKAHHINYRSFVGNSVGKCGVVLSNISKQGQLGAYCVNHRAFVGNVVGKCALRPP